MTDDQHGEGTPQGGGRWDPLPQGDYDDGATAFVELPEGGIDALLAAHSPLAAPGHGYVPPQIAAAPGAEPAAPGAWTTPADGAQWPDSNTVPQETGGAGDRFTYTPAATQHWTYEEPAPPAPAPAPGHDVTGHWSIPVAGGDLPDESGEFTTSSLVEQWGSTPPATLPGGAPAPWATEAAGEPWGQPSADGHPGPPDAQVPGYGTVDAPGHAHEGYGPTEAYGAAAQDDPAHQPLPEAVPASHEDAQAVHEDAHAVHEDVYAVHEDTHAAHEGGHDSHEFEEAAEPADGADPAESAELPEAAEASGPEEAPERGAESPTQPETAADAEGGPETAEGDATADEPGALPEPESAPLHDDHPLASYVLTVNGADRPVTDAWIGESLLYVLRERLGLAGAKDGCSQGECGACNIQVDGRLVASCLVPAVTTAGSEVRTVEGLAADGRPSDVQRALAKCGAVQCGFCVPGMAMTVHDLLEGNPAPTDLEARQALCGNLCRCSGYRGVLDAVQEAVAEREAQAAAEAEAAAGTEADADEARIPRQAGPGAGGVNPAAFESPESLGAPTPHDQPYDETFPQPYDDTYGETYDQSYGQDGGHA
ncbi:2Fe-2S iron-sulfur cluster-binding protein [Streptomyces sp. NPDC046805]|uniref:2Fe-2S iron-sulfur cluster-binding protein n=1 Tax=Streptomyces sp. NPDC046805 TaxID=3155134 RepID=UPI00340CD800